MLLSNTTNRKHYFHVVHRRCGLLRSGWVTGIVRTCTWTSMWTNTLHEIYAWLNSKYIYSLSFWQYTVQEGLRGMLSSHGSLIVVAITWCCDTLTNELEKYILYQKWTNHQLLLVHLHTSLFCLLKWLHSCSWDEETWERRWAVILRLKGPTNDFPLADSV